MKAPYCLFILFVLFSVSAFAQTDSSFYTRAYSALKTTYDAKPVEKVYLHLDKPNYLPGDTLWFKAYIVVGKLHELSALSGVVYTELISPKDSVIKRVTLEVNSGIAWGDMPLSAKLKPGNYHLRAYTRWMRNAGPDYFYDQRINIGGANAFANTGIIAKVNPDVQFFPEGGDLINGLRSKVAFKAISPNGSSEDIKGSIIDNDGNTVAEFNTLHAGMGVFALTPQAGKTYSAKIQLKDSREFSVALPKARNEGFTLALNTANKDSIFIKVSANSQLFARKPNSMFYVLGQSGGEVLYTAAATLKTPVFTATIEKSRFPSGIVQFTLFDDAGQPVSERIAFIKGNDTLQTVIASAKKTYAPREQVNLNFIAKNDAGEPVGGTFSVAVINESRVGTDENAEGSIFSHLLLTSDLKGYVETPNYYFVNTTDKKSAELDVLMLTQGYRRFEWKQILNKPDTHIAYQPQKALSIEGSIKTPSGDLVPNGKLSLISTKDKVYMDTVTNALGNFKFDELYLSDTAKIVLQGRKQHNGKNVAIYVKQPDFPAVTKYTDHRFIINELPAATLQTNFDEYQKQHTADSLKYGAQLQGVTITAKRIAKPDVYNLNGTAPERAVDMKRFKNLNSLKEAVMWAIPLVSVQNGALIYERNPVRLLLDGMDLSKDDLDAYSPSEIDNIRLISASGYENGGFRPAYIVINTKRSAGTDTTVLKQVTITAKKYSTPVLTRSSNLHGPGNADAVLMGDKLIGCSTLADCLRGKLFGVGFKLDGTPVNLSRGGRFNAGSEEMVIIVDGNQLPGNELNNINAQDVLSIEALTSVFSRSIYGNSLGGGALIITLKNGSEQTFVTSEKPSGIITYPFPGFHKARQYYTPKYSSLNQNIGAPDFRSSIYWKPDVTTDKDGKAAFDYFNADTKGTYRVIVEGIDGNGNLGRTVYRYRVE